MSTSNYLEKLLDPVSDAFTRQFAEAVVNLRVDDTTQRHVDGLREKAQEGTLSEEEAQDYRDFVEAVDVVSIIQSKARRFLAQQAK